MVRIAVVYFDAGGGHRASARALVDAIRLQGRRWSVELVNLDDVLEPVDPGYRITGKRGSEWYNWWLRSGWTVGSPALISVTHAAIRVLGSAQRRLLRRCWRRLRPDLVISVVPHFNRPLYESLRAEAGGVPFITLLTDLADYPPHFWIERQQQHFICGTERAARQAAVRGGPEARVWRVSGMVVNPRFYEVRPADRSAGRRRLGLDPNQLTGVVSFGGYGSRKMLSVARHASSSRAQLIFLCGHNQRLAERLRTLRFPFPVHVEGFTENIADLMALGDFFIGKTGPGSISEALLMGLPVIVESSPRTLAHERYNIEWIREQQVGVVLPSFRELPAVIEHLAVPEARRLMRRRAAELNNRAVFEVVDILELVLQGRKPAPALLAGLQLAYSP
jgi:UDP-N-acetylglucosamine:LPS N-acetylglucosamine transferase